jgi:indole-3-glycerol phosphate synthase
MTLMSVESPYVNRDVVLKAKQQHLQMRERRSPWSAVVALASMQASPLNLLNYVDDRIALIGQVRRTRPIYDPVAAAMDMIHAGADAIAFYTDHMVYASDLEDMYLLSRACKDVPVVYQNYVLNIYQVAAARAANASAIWINSSIHTAPSLRANVTTAQRFRFAVFVSVNTLDELKAAVALSPHVLCIGDPDQTDVAAAARWLQQVRASIPSYIKPMLGHTLRTPEEVRLALEAGARAVVVDAALLVRSKIANVVHQWMREAR